MHLFGCDRSYSPKASIGNPAMNSSAWSGCIVQRPSGLRKSEATLARNLLYDIPAEATRFNSFRIRTFISRAISTASLMSFYFLSHPEMLRQVISVQ